MLPTRKTGRDTLHWIMLLPRSISFDRLPSCNPFQPSSHNQFASGAQSGRKREKALSRLRSRPQPGRAERKLWEFYKKISLISSWEWEEKHHSTCRGLNPWPPPELPPDLPAPKRRSCGRRGGPRVALLPYHSTWAREREDRITWRAPPYALFRAFYELLLPPSC